MPKIPADIKEFLCDLVFAGRPAAWLRLDKRGALLSSGGDLATFGLDQLNEGVLVEQHLDVLAGVLDPDFLPLNLPLIEIGNGISADIHLFLREAQISVLFLHSVEKQNLQQATQQRTNDMSLTDRQQTRILDQFLGKEVAKRLAIGSQNIVASGERRNLTVMFADIRGFTTFSENTHPEEVFDVLNIYLAVMIPTVLEGGGVIDKIIGDEVMAIFGMMPDKVDAPDQSLLAAVNMLLAVEKLNRQRRKLGVTQLHLGIGIATGPVSLGLLGSEQRKSITVIGHHVNLASRLQNLAGINELIIDNSTYVAASLFKEQFYQRSVELKGYSAPLNIHQLNLSRLPASGVRLPLP